MKIPAPITCLHFSAPGIACVLVTYAPIYGTAFAGHWGSKISFVIYDVCAESSASQHRLGTGVSRDMIQLWVFPLVALPASPQLAMQSPHLHPARSQPAISISSSWLKTIASPVFSQYIIRGD